MYKKFLCLLVTLLFCLGCGYNPGVDSENESYNQLPIINGAPANHSEYPSIVALMVGSSKTPNCTGTLIKPDLVLTAAHCVGYHPSDMMIAYGYEKPGEGDIGCFFPVLAKSIHPGSYYYDWFPEDITTEPIDSGIDPGTAGENYDDIALLLVDNSPSPVNIVFVPVLPPENYDDVLKVSDIVTIAGYGQHEKGVTGDELYAADVPVTWRGEYEMILGEDEISNPDAGNACYGDSGGPAYVTYGNNIFVSGVTSRAPTIPECGHGAVYTIPGSYLDWIQEAYVEMKEDTPEPEEPEEECDAGTKPCPTCPDASVVDSGVEKHLVLEPTDGCNCDTSCTREHTGLSDLFFLTLFILFGVFIFKRYCK